MVDLIRVFCSYLVVLMSNDTLLMKQVAQVHKECTIGTTNPIKKVGGKKKKPELTSNQTKI